MKRHCTYVDVEVELMEIGAGLFDEAVFCEEVKVCLYGTLVVSHDPQTRQNYVLFGSR